MKVRPAIAPLVAALVQVAAAVLAPQPVLAAPDTEVTGVLDVIAASGERGRTGTTADADTDGGLMFDAQGSVAWVWTLDSGLQPGITLGARAQRTLRDQPSDIRLPGPVVSGAARVETDAWIDRAGVFVRGGWGEVAVGYGPGAAETSLVTVPGMFALAERGGVSATGLAGIGIPEPGLAGSAPRIALTSVRIIGVRASLSWTPASDAGRPDAPRAVRVPGARLEDVAEAGIDATLRLGGLEYGIGLSRSQGSLSLPAAGTSEIALSALSLRVDGDGWRAGFGRRTGWQGPVLGEHASTEMSVGIDRGDWTWLLQAWQSEDSLQPVSVRGVSIRGGFALNERVLLVGGVTSAQREPESRAFSGALAGKERVDGIVAGFSITY